MKWLDYLIVKLNQNNSQLNKSNILQTKSFSISFLNNWILIWFFPKSIDLTLLINAYKIAKIEPQGSEYSHRYLKDIIALYHTGVCFLFILFNHF